MRTDWYKDVNPNLDRLAQILGMATRGGGGGMSKPSHGYTIAEKAPEVVTAPGVYFPAEKGEVIPLESRQGGGSVFPSSSKDNDTRKLDMLESILRSVKPSNLESRELGGLVIPPHGELEKLKIEQSKYDILKSAISVLKPQGQQKSASNEQGQKKSPSSEGGIPLESRQMGGGTNPGFRSPENLWERKQMSDWGPGASRIVDGKRVQWQEGMTTPFEVKESTADKGISEGKGTMSIGSEKLVAGGKPYSMLKPPSLPGIPEPPTAQSYGIQPEATKLGVADKGISEGDLLWQKKRKEGMAAGQWSIPMFSRTNGGGVNSSYGVRADGTQKGKGFWGELQGAEGKPSTELSIGVNFDGKETEIPTLVPTLTQQEIDYLLGGGKPTLEIVDKAVEHARQRIFQGKSPFAQEGEQKPMTFESRQYGGTVTPPDDENERRKKELAELMTPRAVSTPSPTPEISIPAGLKGFITDIKDTPAGRVYAGPEGQATVGPERFFLGDKEVPAGTPGAISGEILAKEQLSADIKKQESERELIAKGMGFGRDLGYWAAHPEEKAMYDFEQMLSRGRYAAPQRAELTKQYIESREVKPAKAPAPHLVQNEKGEYVWAVPGGVLPAGIMGKPLTETLPSFQEYKRIPGNEGKTYEDFRKWETSLKEREIVPSGIREFEMASGMESTKRGTPEYSKSYLEFLGGKKEANPLEQKKLGANLRKEFNNLQPVKDYRDIETRFNIMGKAIKESEITKNFVAVDQALITIFNKMTDPQSVVRESEYIRTPQDLALWNKIKGKVSKMAAGGAGLTPDDRNALYIMAKQFQIAYESKFKELRNEYRGYAVDYGLDPETVIKSKTEVVKKKDYKSMSNEELLKALEE